MQSSNSTYSDGARHTSSYHCYITLNLNQKELYCQVCLHRQGIWLCAEASSAHILTQQETSYYKL